ncbi:Ig-like domain-containing protein [Lacibacter sp. H407]|uniref:Ig-like domain-containing protein n=1 Tax=Lacibacter sp. H407 TaxID=3133423 RepID=UPI0030C4673B
MLLLLGSSIAAFAGLYAKKGTNLSQFTVIKSLFSKTAVPAYADSIVQLKATNITATQATLSWAKSAIAEKYTATVYRKGLKVKSISTSANTTTVTALDAGTTYTWKVTGALSNSTSSTATFTTLAGGEAVEGEGPEGQFLILDPEIGGGGGGGGGGGCTALTWYLDADGDGYWKEGTGSVSKCTSPGAGYRSSGLIAGGDCNDGNSAVYPNAPEIPSDNIDNNCNGQNDETDAVFTFYRDADGDGKGNPAISTTATTTIAPAGYVANALDCNDNDATNSTIRYVNAGVAANGNGTSWGNAYKYLQDALNDDLGCVTEIWVAKGTYYPDEGTGIIDNDRTASFKLLKDVSIYGGFVGTETSLNQRFWESNPTILNGDLNRNDASNFTNMSENSHHVINGGDAGVTGSSKLDGFIIRGGSAFVSTVYEPNNLGGGMYILEATPFIVNCKFINNRAYYGGGVYLGPPDAASGRGAVFLNCEFDGNMAIADGGGVYSKDSYNIFYNSKFLNNKASIGGALMLSEDRNIPLGTPYGMQLVNCLLYKNEATNGGAVFNTGSYLYVINSTFNGNRATQKGGALYLTGNCEAVNSIFWENAAGEEGPEIFYWITDGIIKVTYSIVQTGFFGTGNLKTDPQFVNAAAGDLRLSSSSPAINAGSDELYQEGVIYSLDLDSKPRKFGVIDMGAYELQVQVQPCPSISSITTSPTPASCQGTNVTLTASGLMGMGATYGITFKYFNEQTTDPYTGGTVIASLANSSLTDNGTVATTSTSALPSGNGFIYAVLSPVPANTECRPAQMVNVTINTLSTPPTSITGTTTICSGQSTTLTLSGGTAGTAATAQWFAGSCGSTLIGTGNSITVSPTGNTTYFVRYSGTCNTTTCASVAVTVQSLSIAPTSITGTTTICSGASTTLTLSGGTAGTGAIAEWFSGSCGGTLIGTGNSITVSPTGNTTYFVRYSGTCNTTTCASVAVTVQTLSTAPTGITGTTTICSGGNTTLTISGGTAGTGAIAQWFSGSCGSTLIGTGNSITVSPTGNTTYFVRYSGICNTTTCASVTVTVQALSTAPTGITGTNTICSGGSTTLTISGGTAGTGAIVEWFAGSCEGTPIQTGTNSINVSPAATTTYYARYKGSCNTTECAMRTVTVNTLSVAPTGATGNLVICSGESTTLTAAGGFAGTGATAEWFTGACGGTPIGTGNSITVSPTGTTTYYVRYAGICNVTTCATITVIVKSLSTAPTINGTNIICIGGSTTLTASGGIRGTGSIVEWFAGSCGGTPIQTGTNAITVSPVTTTTYYARYKGDCNTTECAMRTVTVNTLSVAPTGASGNLIICADESTTLTIAGGTAGTGATAQWFAGSCASTLIGTGNSITVSPTGTTSYFVRYAGICNTTTCASVTVTVNTAASIVGPGNLNVANAAGQCGAAVTYSSTITGNPAPVVTYQFSGATNGSGPGTGSGSFFNVGTTDVLLVAENDCGVSRSTFSVTVADSEPPTVNTQSAIVYLNAAGTASVTVAQIDNGSTDNCGIATRTLDISSFTCANVGANTVTLTVKDVNGNEASATATITVVDDIKPTVKTQSVTVYLDANGNANVTAAQVDNGSTDNCAIATRVLNITSFTCANVGANTVTLTVKDVNGNEASATATVTVVDNIAPTISSVKASPSSLWPPNHKMKAVTVTTVSTDNCGTPDCKIISVSSNEPQEGTGDDDVAGDWQITSNNTVNLRAERSGSGNGRIYTITVECKDASGNPTQSTTNVIVAHNITAPMSGSSYKIGSTVSFAGTFWDVPGNKHTARWVIDNSTVTGRVTAEPSGLKNGTVTGSYKFSTAGVYKLKMEIIDQNGNVSYANTNGDMDAIVVIYDPNGGYAFGGGKFYSEAGAQTANPSAKGMVSYGFQSNYFKTATYPKGETQLEFKVGDFEFNALNYEYLAISGAKAQFRGSGKITNGQSGVSFIMTVVDGELNGTGIDKIRMKIFNKNTGEVFYDNQPGASDDIDPITVVKAGSVVTIVNPDATSGGGSTGGGGKPTKREGEFTTETFEVITAPNPSDSYFTLTVKSSNTTDRILVRVMDELGRVVEQKENVMSGTTIRFGDRYIPGMYFIMVQQGKNSKAVKLIRR